MSKEHKFWVEDMSQLFHNIQIVPHKNMPLAEQLNAITRLVFLLAIVLWLFNFPYSIYFLGFSLVFIIIIYYMQRKSMQRSTNQPIEHFDLQPYRSTSVITNYSTQSTPLNQTDVTYITTGEPLPFCNDQMTIDPPSDFAVGLNQSLTGNKVNPNINIKPVVAPPAYDLEYWKDNNLIVLSAINSPGVQQDMYLSGYAESTCCGFLPEGSELVPRKKQSQVQENYQPRKPGAIVSPVPVGDRPFAPVDMDSGIIEPYCSASKCAPGAIRSPVPVEDRPFVPVTEGYTPRREMIVMPNQSGLVNTACGYNPSQVRVNLPSNYPAGNCEQDPIMKQYNKNLFTQIVTPGVYSQSQVNEPINSNIGISFTQQFQPTTCKLDDQGLHYTLHDPRILENNGDSMDNEMSEDFERVNYDNVYDPRFYGYGTSYRSYLEPVTGQTRFMYDDVNAIRMPNYITRSKIDHLPYADHYGPMEPGSEMGNIHNPNVRLLAQDSWFRDSIQFRDDLSQRRMRKVNAEGWQKRMYPNSSRPVGSYAVYGKR